MRLYLPSKVAEARGRARVSRGRPHQGDRRAHQGRARLRRPFRELRVRRRPRGAGEERRSHQRDSRAILANAKDAEDTGHTFTVSLGCVVELVDENGEVTEVTIVGSTETDSLRHRISNESPIGRAIINHAEGETVDCAQLPLWQDAHVHHHARSRARPGSSASRWSGAARVSA